MAAWNYRTKCTKLVRKTKPGRRAHSQSGIGILQVTQEAGNRDGSMEWDKI